MGNNFVKIDENRSDEEIVDLIIDGNYELFGVIIERYYPLVCSIVRKYCPAKISEDAVQEATLALYNAVKTYDKSRSSFRSFANLCVKRSVISVLKGSKRKRIIPDELVSSIEELEIVDANSPEKIFFDREDYKNLTDIIKLELSNLEYSVLECYLEGESYADIAKRLNITEKAVDNALSRIRKKLTANAV